MLPIPFKDFSSILLRNKIPNDDGGLALVNKADSHLEDWKSDILEQFFLKLADRMPHLFLDELGYYLNADLKAFNSGTTKRIKIDTAVSRHKVRGTWENDTKIRIDAITGYSAAVYTVGDTEDCIEMGGLSSEPDFYWSTERGDDTLDTELGTWEVGFGTEYIVAGNIYIDCHEGVIGSTLTAEQIEQIVAEVSLDVVPAYYRVYLCYVDGSGSLVVYSGGTIE